MVFFLLCLAVYLLSCTSSFFDLWIMVLWPLEDKSLYLNFPFSWVNTWDKLWGHVRNVTYMHTCLRVWIQILFTINANITLGTWDTGITVQLPLVAVPDLTLPVWPLRACCLSLSLAWFLGPGAGTENAPYAIGDSEDCEDYRHVSFGWKSSKNDVLSSKFC